MKNQLLKKTNFFVLIFVSYILLSLASCKKDEDTTPPEISIISPSLNDTVRNNVEIKFEAKDNEGVSYIELYANDSLMGEITNSTNSYTWNTLGLKDDEYNLKCKVFDKSGNYKEDSRVVTVQNALIKLDIGELYGDEYNILITDSSGNVLAKSTFKTGDKFTIYPTADFHKKCLNIIYFNSNGTSTSTQVYLNVRRGFKLQTRSRYFLSTNSVKIHLKKTNVEFLRSMFSTNISSYGYIDNYSDSLNLDCTPNSKLLVQVKKAEGWFYKFVDLTNKSDIWIDLSEIDLVQSTKVITLPDGFIGDCSLMGCLRTNELTDKYYISNFVSGFGENKVVVHYPNSGFEEISSFIGGGSNNGIFYDNIVKGQVPETLIPLKTNAQIINSKTSDFKMSLNGECDFYILKYKNNNSLLSIFSTSGITQFKLPDLVSIYNNANLNYQDFTLKELKITKVHDMPKDIYIDNYIHNNTYLVPWKNSQSQIITF